MTLQSQRALILWTRFADTVKISYGDAIQFGAAVGLSLCPGAPKINAFVGRPNATQAAPDKTVPEPQDDLTGE